MNHRAAFDLTEWTSPHGNDGDSILVGYTDAPKTFVLTVKKENALPHRIYSLRMLVEAFHCVRPRVSYTEQETEEALVFISDHNLQRFFVSVCDQFTDLNMELVGYGEKVKTIFPNTMVECLWQQNLKCVALMAPWQYEREIEQYMRSNGRLLLAEDERCQEMAYKEEIGQGRKKRHHRKTK